MKEKIDPIKQMKQDYEKRLNNAQDEIKYLRGALERARMWHVVASNILWVKSFFLVFFAAILALSVFGIIFR